jgi:hypothetical protein
MSTMPKNEKKEKIKEKIKIKTKGPMGAPRVSEGVGRDT